MTNIALLGAGAGGCSAAVDLTLRGHRVRLWNRRSTTLGPLMQGGALRYTGVLGHGSLTPQLATTDLRAALDGADVAVMCQPALAHGQMLAELAEIGLDLPLVLNPGHTAGALHARAVFAEKTVPLPPIAELSTLTYVARKPAPDQVAVLGKAGRVHVASFPGGEAAVGYAVDLFPAATPAADVLATSLANVNLVLHPPGAILGAAWVEATKGDFTFYVEGMTPGVARLVEALDAERLQVARAFGHELPTLLDEMAAIGTVERAGAEAGDYGPAIRGAAPNSTIKAPDSLRHRYYQEDFPFAVVPFMGLARIADVATPLAESLLRLSECATGEQFAARGLTAQRLGIDGLCASELSRLVRSAD
jgi:opine dehydrogenase